MKFAKELDRDAVPEWRAKYLNYKAGKKRVKAVARAIAMSNANATPRTSDRPSPSRLTPGRSHAAADGRAAWTSGSAGQQVPPPHSQLRPEPISVRQTRGHGQPPGSDGPPPVSTYGSFIATPPATSPLRGDAEVEPSDEQSEREASNFELPAPSMRVSPEASARDDMSKESAHSLVRRYAMQRSATLGHVPASPQPDGASRAPRRPSLREAPARLRHLFADSFPYPRRTVSGMDVRMQVVPSFDLVREREREFFEFMDAELDKVDAFYAQKEEHAGTRLAVLREQLHEMRNRRLHEMARAQRGPQGVQGDDTDDDGADRANGWARPIRAKMFGPGPNSQALMAMPETPLLASQRHGNAARDYIRRPDDREMPYRKAKRKLKLALQEFYRSLELLKSYALLNRTAFRKLNKKFDKAVNARPTYRYMNEKVNKTRFVTSDVLDGHIKAVEDMYARYFEKGNHKEPSGDMFLNGLLLGAGVVLAVQGTISGRQLLFSDSPVLRVQTSYLLQLYGGYFLMWLLFSLFCANCFIWTQNRISYAFVFEFDQRHHLDWRQLSHFSSFSLLFFGLIMWANFTRIGPEGLFLYYPVILIATSFAVLFMPAPILAHRSRQWFLFSHWRMILAGLLPVEFRDFFLGDIYCSLTYAMANIEVFFCLYAHRWNDPPQCNSTSSRLLGFLTTLPSLWRLFQCLRRFRDTRNWFPHLANAGKYSMTTLSYTWLSLYRISRTHANLALFIVFSTINAVYCTLWDLVMDFSLLQPMSRNFLLRDILAMKQRWPYYLILVVDPVLRFAWIFYAIFTHDTQHSTIVVFLASLAEVCRRGMWTQFRVENEHCSNVAQYKASRDVPLPYHIEPLLYHASAEASPMLAPQDRQPLPLEQSPSQQRLQQQRQQWPSPQADIEGGTVASSTAVPTTPLTGLARRRTDASKTGPRSFSRMLAEAHKQDFEKRRRPVDHADEDHDGQSDEEDEEEEEQQQEAYEVQEAADLSQRGGARE